MRFDRLWRGARLADRSDEFERRLAGADYQEIARAGGGILSTARATCKATERELIASAAARPRTQLVYWLGHSPLHVRIWRGE